MNPSRMDSKSLLSWSYDDGSGLFLFSALRHAPSISERKRKESINIQGVDTSIPKQLALPCRNPSPLQREEENPNPKSNSNNLSKQSPRERHPRGASRRGRGAFLYNYIRLDFFKEKTDLSLVCRWLFIRQDNDKPKPIWEICVSYSELYRFFTELLPKEKENADGFGIFGYLVGMAGFEPAIFCSQSRRDNQASLHPERVILWSNPPWVASKKEPEALISAPESQEARFITPLLRHFIVFLARNRSFDGRGYGFISSLFYTQRVKARAVLRNNEDRFSQNKKHKTTITFIPGRV